MFIPLAFKKENFHQTAKGNSVKPRVLLVLMPRLPGDVFTSCKCCEQAQPHDF